MNIMFLYQCIKITGEEAGINRISMHGLRHTYATHAVEYSILPKVLQELLDHTSSTTTMDVYVQVTDTLMRDAVDAFACSRKNGVKMA